MRENHGKRRDPIYAIWSGMHSRCGNPNNAAYENYGGRGINVCERWQSFSNFYADMGDPPPGLSLDRIDNDGGYCPDNCRWATRAQQSRNRRDRRLYTIGNDSLLLSDWARRTGLRIGTLHYRLKLGWTIEAAVSTPVVSGRKGKPRGYRWAEPDADLSDRRIYGLTQDEVATIRAAPRGYGTGRALARQYGVSDAAISRIRIAA